MPVTQSESETAGFAPIAAKSGKAIELSMQQLVLTGRVLPVGARLVVRHSFSSAEEEPIEVVYCFALPRDAALRRFRISGEGFCARSELKPVEEAEKTYEEGLELGHLSQGDKARVGDCAFGAFETQRLEPCQPFQVAEPRIRDAGALEAQGLESCETLQIGKPGVGDSHVVEVQLR